ncbi:hypothetical protein WAI453_003166 [Rhynchosporium graminicola]|uniref:Uncharacterized protein n=1 Tax=Rhynchosporium graminicola TaxID=2792576 RepID=A0A1E1LN02_9HELO|nr:uncharacterized protein RCO7_07451 [Rhynchosporium commune]
MATEVAVDDMSIYEHMRKYDWDSDQVYQGGLKAILGPDPSPASDLILHAQCFYFSRKNNTKVDFNGYKEYLDSHSSQNTFSNPTSSNSAPISDSPSTATQIAREPSGQPHHQPRDPMPPDMAVSSTHTNPALTPESGEQDGAQDGAPYPRSFAEIVALIQSGAPIPGIKEIDDTPRGLAASSPSVMPKRRKPWEKDVPEEVIQGRGPGTFGDSRDRIIEQEYPDA